MQSDDMDAPGRPGAAPIPARQGHTGRPTASMRLPSIGETVVFGASAITAIGVPCCGGGDGGVFYEIMPVR